MQKRNDSNFTSIQFQLNSDEVLGHPSAWASKDTGPDSLDSTYIQQCLIEFFMVSYRPNWSNLHYAVTLIMILNDGSRQSHTVFQYSYSSQRRCI